MKIAINNLPLKSVHKTRGIGYYTKSLIEVLESDPAIIIQKFANLSEVSNAQVVHYPWFDLFFHTLPIRRCFPTVVTIHDCIPLVFAKHYPQGFKAKINFILQKIALNSCKYIITDSQISKKDIMEYLGVENRKISVIPLAVDPKFQVLSHDSKLQHIKRQYRLPDQFLLYVGDANWVKNLPFLIEGFYRLKKLPKFTDTKLVLAGGVFLKNVENINHPELESLKLASNLIKQYGLDNFVIRPGQINDMELVAFYNLATIYAQPSIYEGFGLPVLEAMSCGTPVVCSNRGSLPEVGGKAALYFDPANLEQFVFNIQEVLEDKLLQTKLAKLGLKQVEKFSWKRVAEQTKSVYLQASNE